MALIPHKEDPNYKQQMEEYAKDNSRWGGADMLKGMSVKVPAPLGSPPGHGVVQQPKR